MHFRKAYIFLLNLSTLFNLIIHVRSLFHEITDARGLDPGKSLDTSNLGQEELIRPVDKNLLQEKHLNTWRHLRTIEVVVRKNKHFQIYSRTLEKALQSMFKDLQPKEIDMITSHAEGWATYKPNKSLAVVVYYLLEVLKHQSSQLQGTEEELYRLTQRMVKATNFSQDLLETHMVPPFLDAVMSELSLHMLLEQYGKSMIADHEHSSNLLPGEGKFDWKQIILQTDQLKYIKHYQAYMKLIEVFEILAASALKHTDLIYNHLTPSLARSMPAIRILFEEHFTNVRQMHRYIMNKTPYHNNMPLTFPIFANPNDIDGIGSACSENIIHKLWSLSDETDSQISSRIIKYSNKPTATLPTDNPHKLPRYIYRMRGFVAMRETASSSSLRHRQMMNHISRTINLVVNLKDDGFEAHTVLSHILQTALRTLPMDKPEESERRIENCVMFYLLIRRMARVLEVAIKKWFPSTIPNHANLKANIVMYYWSILSFVPSSHQIRAQETFERMEFGLGRVYLDHLQSSMTLNKLYEQMSLVQKNGQANHSPISIQTDQTDLSEDELIDDISVKSKERQPKKYRNKSKKRKKTFASSDNSSDDDDYEPQQLYRSLRAKGTVQGKGFNEKIKDWLNFKIPKKKSSRYPILSSDKNVSDEQVEVPDNRERHVMDDEMCATRDLLMPFTKRPRTKTCKVLSPENDQTNSPKNDKKQTLKHQQTESIQQEQGRKEFIQNTGSESHSSVLDRDVPENGPIFHHFNLNEPLEETFDSPSIQDTVPELHNSWKLTSDRVFHNGLPRLSEPTETSFHKARTSSQLEGPESTRTEQSVSHNSINQGKIPDLNEEIPDLNIPI